MARLTEGAPLVRLSIRIAPEERDALERFAEQGGRPLNLSAELRRLIVAEQNRQEEAGP